MSANERQVGGDHYKAKYQHWDLADDIKLPYFESAATKYLARWRVKNGLQDLEKSLHYLVKRRELFVATGLKSHVYFEVTPEAADKIRDFVTETKMDPEDQIPFIMICRWDDLLDLDVAITALQKLCAQNQFYIVAEKEDK